MSYYSLIVIEIQEKTKYVGDYSGSVLPGLSDFPINRISTEAKEAYFKALRAEVPELLKIATGKEASPPELDTFAAAFAVAGEDQEKVADEETLVLPKRFSGNRDVRKAQAEFDRAQEVEERFHHDFEEVDFTQR